MTTDVQFALRQIRTSISENIKTSDETGSKLGSGHSCSGFVGPLKSSSYNKNFGLCLSMGWVASSALWPFPCVLLECCRSPCTTFNWLVFQKQDAAPLRLCVFLELPWLGTRFPLRAFHPLHRGERKSMLRLQRDLGKAAKLRTKRRDRDGVAGGWGEQMWSYIKPRWSRRGTWPRNGVMEGYVERSAWVCVCLTEWPGGLQHLGRPSQTSGRVKGTTQSSTFFRRVQPVSGVWYGSCFGRQSFSGDLRTLNAFHFCRDSHRHKDNVIKGAEGWRTFMRMFFKNMYFSARFGFSSCR